MLVAAWAKTPFAYLCILNVGSFFYLLYFSLIPASFSLARRKDIFVSLKVMQETKAGGSSRKKKQL